MGTIMARDIYPRLAGGVEVAAVVDRHLERGGPLAAGLGATAYVSLDAALRERSIDAVDIRLQHAAHSAATIEALQHGLHVLVEKPLATTLEECYAMIAAADRAGLTVAVAENYPHLAAVRATRAALASGVVGELLTLRSTRVYTLEGVWANTVWRQGENPMAGILWDQGTHHTSMLRAIAGEVTSVAARSSSRLATEGAEAVMLTLQFKSGVVGQSLYCWGAPAVELETEATAFGTSGRVEITVDYEGGRGLARISVPEGSRNLSAVESYYDSHRLIVEDWANAIHTGAAPRGGLADATADVEGGGGGRGWWWWRVGSRSRGGGPRSRSGRCGHREHVERGPDRAADLAARGGAAVGRAVGHVAVGGPVPRARAFRPARRRPVPARQTVAGRRVDRCRGAPSRGGLAGCRRAGVPDARRRRLNHGGGIRAARPDSQAPDAYERREGRPARPLLGRLDDPRQDPRQWGAAPSGAGPDAHGAAGTDYPERHGLDARRRHPLLHRHTGEGRASFPHHGGDRVDRRWHRRAHRGRPRQSRRHVH